MLAGRGQPWCHCKQECAKGADCPEGKHDVGASYPAVQLSSSEQTGK